MKIEERDRERMEKHRKCERLTFCRRLCFFCKEFQGQSRERADLLGQEASLLKYYAETFDLQVRQDEAQRNKSATLQRCNAAHRKRELSPHPLLLRRALGGCDKPGHHPL